MEYTGGGMLWRSCGNQVLAVDGDGKPDSMRRFQRSVMLSEGRPFAERMAGRSRSIPTRPQEPCGFLGLRLAVLDASSTVHDAGDRFGSRDASTAPGRSLRDRPGSAQHDKISRDQLLFFIQGYHSAAKSSQCGFLDSIRAIFFARDQPFNCFSRAIAK